MQKLFETQFGSRLYGTNTPTSDTDLKVVFLPDIEDLLVCKKVQNVMKTTGNDVSKNNNDDVDLEFIPIQIFAKDFIDGQTYAIEVAFSVLAEEYVSGQVLHNPFFKVFVEELTRFYMTSNISAMMGYALNQAQIYGIKGSRLASIRKLNDIIEDAMSSDGTTLETKFSILEKAIQEVSDKYLYVTDYEVNDGRAPAVACCEKIYPLNISMFEAYKRVTAQMGKYGERAKRAESAEGVDWKAVSHAVRITLEAIDILTNKELKLPFNPDRVSVLLAIKQGEMDFKEVQEILTQLIEKVDEAKTTTTLPGKSEELYTKFEDWLKTWMCVFYNIA